MNPWDIVIGAGVALLLGLALYVVIRKRKKGCSCCGGSCCDGICCGNKSKETEDTADRNRS